MPDEHELQKVKTKLRDFEVDATEMTASLEEMKKKEGKASHIIVILL